MLQPIFRSTAWRPSHQTRLNRLILRTAIKRLPHACGGVSWAKDTYDKGSAVEPTGLQRMISVHRTSHILRLSLSQESPDHGFLQLRPSPELNGF